MLPAYVMLPALEQHLGQYVFGVMMPGGGVGWSFGRKRALGP
jgi:hypothetical protein